MAFARDVCTHFVAVVEADVGYFSHGGVGLSGGGGVYFDADAFGLGTAVKGW